MELRIDPQLWAGVKAVAAAHNATASMVLQAVVAVVLHRVGAGEDVALGAPIAGRSDAALEELVGFFVNTWVLRVGVSAPRSGSARCSSRCARRRWMPTATRMCRSSDWSSSSIRCARPRIIRCSRWRWSSRTTCAPRWSFDGVSLEPVGMVTRTAKFDLDIQLSEVPSEDPGVPMAAGTLTYATDLYERSTIERLVGWFEPGGRGGGRRRLGGGR